MLLRTVSLLALAYVWIASPALSVETSTAGATTQTQASVDDLRARADAGDADAQFQLGLRLIESATSSRDISDGEQWLLKAIAVGHTPSRATLGKMYLDGYHFKGKQTAGRRLLEEAAKKGDAKSQFSLGVAYLWGTGVSQNSDKAESYLRDAMANGDLAASRVLGEQLITGWVIRRNDVEGRQILESAISQGNVEAKVALGKLLFEGYYVAPDRDRGGQLLTEAASSGNRDAKASLGLAYAEGRNFAQDWPRGLALLRESAKGKDGIRRLGEALARYGSTEGEKAEGLELLQAGVEAGDPQAHVLLGKILLESKTSSSRQSAIELFEKAAKLGNGEGLELVGRSLMWNSRTPAEAKAAERYLQSAAKAGRGSAWTTLAEGAMYSKLGSGSRSKKYPLYAKSARAAGQEKVDVLDAERSMWGLGVKSDPRKTLSILSNAAKKKNQTATLYLIALLRDGNGWNIKKSLKQAKRALENFGTQLPYEVKLQQEILLSAANSTSIADFKKAADVLLQDGATKSTAFNRDLYRVNPNLGVYILQSKLKKHGLYQGSLNGKLTARTIDSIRQACKRQPKSLQCEKNVLSENSVAALLTHV